jgi:hypothetical protein
MYIPAYIPTFTSSHTYFMHHTQMRAAGVQHASRLLCMCRCCWCAARIAAALHVQVLLAGVQHPSEAVRVDCLELAALNPKPTEPPGKLELQVGLGGSH